MKRKLAKSLKSRSKRGALDFGRPSKNASLAKKASPVPRAKKTKAKLTSIYSRKSKTGSWM